MSSSDLKASSNELSQLVTISSARETVHNHYLVKLVGETLKALKMIWPLCGRLSRIRCSPRVPSTRRDHVMTGSFHWVQIEVKVRLRLQQRLDYSRPFHPFP